MEGKNSMWRLLLKYEEAIRESCSKSSNDSKEESNKREIMIGFMRDTIYSLMTSNGEVKEEEIRSLGPITRKLRLSKNREDNDECDG